MQVRKGNLRIGWSYDSARQQPATTNCIGVDTGISDCFHTSDGRAIGSMSPVIDFYHEEVEPAFAELASLRNKKRKIKHFLRKHDLPEDVRRSLIKKMDHLERMIQTAKSPVSQKALLLCAVGSRDQEISHNLCGQHFQRYTDCD